MTAYGRALGKRGLSFHDVADGTRCNVCGAPALTVAPIYGKQSAFLGGCSKHPEGVLEAMKKASAIKNIRRERKRDEHVRHLIRDACSGTLPEHKKKTY